MFRKTHILFGILLFFTIPLMAQGEEEKVRAPILDRFKKLHNLIVNCKVTTEYPMMPDIKPEKVITKKESGGLSVMATGTKIEHLEFSILENKTRYDTNLDSWDRKIESPYLDEIPFVEKRIRVCGPDRSEHFDRTKGVKVHSGEIRNDMGLPPWSIIDVALGLRKYEDKALLTEKSIREMTIEQPDSNQVILSDVDSDRLTHKLFFDKKLGYALTRYRIMRILDPNVVYIEITMGNFKNIDGILLPFTMHAVEQMSYKGKTYNSIEWDIQVASYRLNDPNNTAERYYIKWPERTRVFDYISGLRYITTKPTSEGSQDDVSDQPENSKDKEKSQN